MTSAWPSDLQLTMNENLQRKHFWQISKYCYPAAMSTHANKTH